MNVKSKTNNRFSYLPLLVLLVMGCAAVNTLHAQDRLWGMTSGGGANNLGAIFSMNPDGTGLAVKYSFTSSSVGMQPYGSLVSFGDSVYGLTSGGGLYNSGVIFSVDTATGGYTKLYDFDGAANGSLPMEGLSVGPDGKLYGVTTGGGANYDGIIFSLDPATGAYQKLYDMSPATGDFAFGPLTLYHDKFYGLTLTGGTYSNGVFFSFDPATNTYTDIHNYVTGSQDGYQSPGKMVVYNDVLYGVCTGGDNGRGQLFSYSDGGTGYTVLNEFNSGTEYEPSGITLYNDKLYGITWEGGVNYWGGTFSYDPNSGAYNEIMGFDPYINPDYGSIIAYNGKLLGFGASYIFQVDINSGAYVDLVDYTSFQPNIGGYPMYGTLVLPVIAAIPVTGTTPQTVSVSNNTVKTYGDTSFDPGATASSNLKIAYASSDKTVATVTGTKIKIVGVGTCVITASQRGDTTYAAAAAYDTLIVNPAPLLVTADNKTANQLQPFPVFTAHYTGFVYGDTVLALTTLPVITPAATIASPQGTYDIIAGGATAANYTISYQKGTLTITGQLQVLTLDSAIHTYGDPDFQMVTSNSGLPVTYSIDSSDIAVVATADTTLIHITGAGTTRVIARQTGNTTWGPMYNTVVLTINKAPLTITANDTSIVYGQPIPPFTATYSGLVYGETAPAIFTVPPVLISTNPETPAYPGIYQIQITNAVARNYVLTNINGIFTVSASGDSINVFCSSPHQLAANVMSAKARKATFSLYSLDGRQVLTTDVSLSSGLNYLTFPANLATGIYIARLKGEDIKLSQKVMVY